MRRFLLLTLLVGCTDNANIGLSKTPVQCQSAAAGVVNGSVTNTASNKTYSFSSPQASLIPVGPNSGMTINFADSSLRLELTFECGQPALGTYDAAGGQAGCPFSVNGIVSGNQQQIYGFASSGEVIVDQDSNCIAGRYDLHFDNTNTPNSDRTSGDLSGWFSVPVQ